MKSIRDDSELEKISGNINIWHEVTETTKKILITNEDPNSQGVRFFKAIRDKWPKKIIGYKKPPECVIINFYGRPELEIDTLEGLPLNLANLETFITRKIKLKNLSGMPQNLPNLKSLGVGSLKL